MEAKNRMSPKALARSIGPSIIGFPSPTPTLEEIKNAAKFQVSLTLRCTYSYFIIVGRSDVELVGIATFILQCIHKWIGK